MAVITCALATSVFITRHDIPFGVVCPFSADSPIKLHCVYRTRANKLVLAQTHTHIAEQKRGVWGIKILDASIALHILRFCIIGFGRQSGRQVERHRRLNGGCIANSMEQKVQPTLMMTTMRMSMIWECVFNG